MIFGRLALGLVFLASAVADARDATLVALTEEIPTNETGIPVDFRVDRESAFVVAVHASHVWSIDLGTSERRKVTLTPLEGLSQLVIYGVDRLAKNRLVVSAGWIERQSGTRGGLIFTDDEGTIESKVGYGISIRSIAVSPSRNLIAASIQEPLDPLSEDGSKPTMFPLAVFDSAGHLLTRLNCNSANRYSSFDQMHELHPFRRVFFSRDSPVITFPESSSKFRHPSVYAVSPTAVRLPDEGARRSTGNDATSGSKMFMPPTLEGVARNSLRMLNVIPVLDDGYEAYLAIWLAGPSDKQQRPTPHRDEGRVFVAVYGSDGQEPKRMTEIVDGTRIAEITTAPGGRAAAITYRDMSKAWRISEIDF